MFGCGSSEIGRKMAIRTRNLNLIPLLRALLEEGSVAAAADKSGLSQPAMSGALARLREEFDDPLLVRVGRSMQPTPFALKIQPRVVELCAEMEALFEPEVFDPATATSFFRIAAPHYLSLLLMNKWLEKLAVEAPKVRIDFVDVPVDLPHWLGNASIDAAVCGDFGLWEELRKSPAYNDRATAVVSSNHPLAGREIVSKDDLAQFPSVGTIYNASFPFSTGARDSLVGIPSFDSPSQLNAMTQFCSLILATKTQLVARAPGALAHWMTQVLPLVVLEISDEETEFSTSIFWSVITDASPPHQWLRQSICEALGGYEHLVTTGEIGAQG